MSEDGLLVRLLTNPGKFARILQRAVEDALPLLTTVGAVVCLLVVGVALFRRFRAARMCADARRIQVLAPPDVAAHGAQTLWMGLHAILRPAWKRLLFGQPHLAWEVEARPDALDISLWVPRTIPPGLVERTVESAWPGTRAESCGDMALLSDRGQTAVTELVLAQPECFPIGDAPDTEPLRLALGVMTALEPDESAAIQILARPATSAARLPLLRAARRLRRAAPATAAPFWATGSGRGGSRAVSRPLMDPTVDQDVRAILAKASSPLWQCSVRVAVSAPRRAQASGKIHALAGAFAVFEGRNGFRRRRVLGATSHLEARSFGRGYLLSVPELAQVAALPAEAVPGLERARARTLAPPRALPKAGRLLGRSDHSGVSRPVAISVPDGRHHIHVVGETGTGKSTLIARMVLEDAAAKRAAVVIDPKGDLVESVLQRLPADAVERTCLLEPDDPDHAVGLNMLDGASPDLVIDHIVGAFRRIYDPHWGPRTDYIMRSLCMTLIQIEGATLADAPQLLIHEDWWRAVAKRLKDIPGLGSFWKWYEQLGEKQRSDTISPLMNKLQPFELRGALRAIVGQAEPKLDIERHINNGGILLVRIPKGTLGDDTSQLIGTFVVARVWQAAVKRASIPEEWRPDTTLYVDEVHNYLALPRSFEDLLAEARGYRLSLVLAHQHMNQLPRNMREALAANARTKLVFACSPEDADHLERHYEPHLTAHDLHNLAAFQVACRPCVDASHGQAFTFRTEALDPPERSAASVRSASAARFACLRQDVETAIADRLAEAKTDLLPEGFEEREARRAERRSAGRSMERPMSPSVSRPERPTPPRSNGHVSDPTRWADG